MSWIFNLIAAIGALVFFHELGHFVIAKLLHVKVEKFALGFGPEWFGFSTAETRYSVNLIPLGGYVRMLGDEPGETHPDLPRSYQTQKWYQRALIVAAGPLTNFILAVILLTTLFMVGISVLDTSTSAIGKVIENTPAQQAGLQSGDIIASINGQPVKNWDEVTKIIQPNSGNTLSLVVRRNNKEISIQAKPEYKAKVKHGILGISPGRKIVEKEYPWPAFKKAVKETAFLTVFTVKAIWWIISGRIAPDVAGPIGMAQLVQEATKVGFANVVYLVVVLSINLGIFNLFPIPILDGGHIMFLIIEGFRGKPVSAFKIAIAQKAGLAILVTIFLFATYKDIIRLLRPGPK
ncbi:MAG: RIP metalloprotease RseP [Elusimicrobia bacterium]|nr:RIP metalloprotease RseP [Elusimicrobiota bacterium]